MPLDQAVYVPATGSHGEFIAAVRGGYVFNFNASTGAKVSSVRFSPFSIYNATICYEPVNDRLVISYFGDPNADSLATAYCSIHRLLYVLNPASFAQVSTYDPQRDNAQLPSFYWNFTSPFRGPYLVIALGNGEILCVAGLAGTTGLQNSAFIRDIGTGISRTYTAAPGNGEWITFQEKTWAVLKGVYAYISAYGNTKPTAATILRLSDCSIPQYSPIPYPCVRCGPLWAAADKTGVGGDYAPSSDTVYIVSRSPTIFRMSGTYLENTVNSDQELDTDKTDITLPDADAMPFNVRFNAYDNMLYVPGYSNNKVYVIDAATDTLMATKTGFDSPWDAVFTPTKKFAVQHGSVGLKEIV